jgi:pimeloyl-ACP methyl ester carboxylesterase
MNPASFTPTNLLLRTNLAAAGAGGIRTLRYGGHALANLGSRGRPTYGTIIDATDTTEDCLLRMPARPAFPPRIVICAHGHGGTPTSFGETDANIRPLFEALERAGFICVIPRMGGTNQNQWGNDTALGFVMTRFRQLKQLWGIDPHVFLFGTSMGGGACATMIVKNLFPVRAAYLAQPAVNLEWISGQAAFNTILTAYADSTARDRNDPMKYPAGAWNNVPIYATSSYSDTSVRRGENADRMKALLGSQVTLFTSSGNHNDASNYKADAMLDHFLRYAG